MLARSRQLLATGVFLVDGAILYAAWLAAYWLRFHGLGLAAPLGLPPPTLYLWSGAVLSLFGLLVLRSFRLYRSARTARLASELYFLALAMAIVTLGAGMGSFFARGELSRLVVVIFFPTGTLALWASRVAIRLALRWLRRHGRNLRHVLIVGTGDQARTLVDKINQHPGFGLRISGLVATDAARVGQSAAGQRVLGTVEDLPRLVEERSAEIVYIALPRPEWQAEEQALRSLADSTAAVRLVPDLAQAYRLNPSVEDFDGLPVVLVTESPEQGWNAVLKRAFDLACSAAGLVVLSPLLLAITILVRLDSPGPVFFRQERVGMNGRRFRMIKFRSMRVDAEARGAAWTTRDDPRRTRFGETLRRFSLDELPQLWNVLMGDMSLVGPRPEQPAYVERFRSSVPLYMLRHHVRSGMTGWAQVHGLRGDTPLERRIEYDLYYIQHWSLGLDVKILALTLARVFRDASAY